MPIDHKYLFVSLTVSQLIVTKLCASYVLTNLLYVSIKSGVPALFSLVEYQYGTGKDITP